MCVCVCVCVYVGTRAALPGSADQLQSRITITGNSPHPTVMIRKVRQPLPPLPYNWKGASSLSSLFCGFHTYPGWSSGLL